MAVYTFDSVEGFVEASLAPASGATTVAVALHRGFMDGLPTDWLLPGNHRPNSTTSLKDIAELVSRGWDEGRKSLEALLDRVSVTPPTDIRRRRTWADQGDEVCVERIWAGQLDSAWRATPRTGYGTSRRLVTVAVDIIDSQHVQANDLFWRGAAAVVFANAATEAGYSVQIVAAFRGHSSLQTDTVCRVIVKPYLGGFDLSSASAIALPGFFRGLAHAWAFGHLSLGREVGLAGWLPQPLAFSDLSGMTDGAATFVVGQDVNTEDDVLAWLGEAVADLDAGASGGLGTD